jgi:hypothetical protein
VPKITFACRSPLALRIGLMVFDHRAELPNSYKRDSMGTQGCQ